MGILELCLIAVGLSMDAFAVSVCRGVKMKRINLRHTVSIALCFGFFQAVMPFIGWAVGFQFYSYIIDYDHWIAFSLLLFIGCKMLYEAFKPEKDEEEHDCLKFSELIMMGVATSIDALAVGISFAVLPDVNIYFACILIGIITTVICFAAVFIGKYFGDKFRNKAEIIGGVILILIGFRILIEHLFAV